MRTKQKNEIQRFADPEGRLPHQILENARAQVTSTNSVGLSLLHAELTDVFEGHSSAENLEVTLKAYRDLVTQHRSDALYESDLNHLHLMTCGQRYLTEHPNVELMWMLAQIMDAHGYYFHYFTMDLVREGSTGLSAETMTTLTKRIRISTKK